MSYTFNVLCFLGGDVEGDLCLVLYNPSMHGDHISCLTPKQWKKRIENHNLRGASVGSLLDFFLHFLQFDHQSSEMIRTCDGNSMTYGVDVLCFLGGEIEGDLCLILYMPL
ncbi:hypothetical protein ACSBR2_025132 [Camellia fascicularis]